MGTILKNYEWIGQTQGNGCAYAVANQIIRYYNVKNPERVKVEEYDEVDQQTSAIALLEKALPNLKAYADDHSIMTMGEIMELISKGNPIVSLVGETAPIEAGGGRYHNDLNFQGGHWIVIIGYRTENGLNEICVSDPGIGYVWIKYGGEYKLPDRDRMFFENSTAYLIGDSCGYFKNDLEEGEELTL